MAVWVVLVGIRRRGAARLAVELRRIRVTAAIDDLRRQPGEQRLCPFSSINQFKLSLRLGTDEDLEGGGVESNRLMAHKSDDLLCYAALARRLFSK
jgi:hypothetical protein